MLHNVRRCQYPPPPCPLYTPPDITLLGQAILLYHTHVANQIGFLIQNPPSLPPLQLTHGHGAKQFLGARASLLTSAGVTAPVLFWAII